jgi:hypothetical protein
MFSGERMRLDVIRKDRQPNYTTPKDCLLWGYKCTSKSLDKLKEGNIKGSQKAVYDVREAIRDALFLLGFRGKIDDAIDDL